MLGRLFPGLTHGLAPTYSFSYFHRSLEAARLEEELSLPRIDFG